MARTTICAFASILVLSATLAVAQPSEPVAWIYVTSRYNGQIDQNRVVGYAAGTDGRLTEIPGSPWADNLYYLATNGGYLFGSTDIGSDNGRNVFSYKIESNGALQYISANNIQHMGSENGCNAAEELMLDHTGSYLYVTAGNACGGDSVEYQSLAVNKNTGLLSYLGDSDTLPEGVWAHPLTMLADNDYAYANDGNQTTICGYKKESNGALVSLTDSNNCSVLPPTAGFNGNAQVEYAAADPTNHLAAVVEYYSPNVIKIATIAVDTANGAQSSESTFDNMPDSSVESPSALEMAPSGKKLAVAGSNGIQIYNFNPNGEAIPATGLITSGPITAMYWDTSNHLYAISSLNNTLQVFTVTDLGVTEAPGSPYTIPIPVAMIGHSM